VFHKQPRENQLDRFGCEPKQLCWLYSLSKLHWSRSSGE